MNKPTTPPKLPLRFFRWFCHPDYVEDIEGDLRERFEKKAAGSGKVMAKLQFITDVLRLCRPGIIRPMGGSYQLNYYGMLTNHVKTSWRLLKREKFFTAINIVGLTSGIWCTLLIALWIQDEMSYDRFHEKGASIYHLLRNVKHENGNIHTEQLTAYPIGEELAKDFPEIKAQVRLAESESMVLKIGDTYLERTVAAADPNFFQVFSFPMVQGSAEICLSELNSVVISAELAANHFPGRSAVGETITLNQGPYSIDFYVTGVFERPAVNSSIQFDAVLPLDLYLEFNTSYESWGNSWLKTYLLLDPLADAEALARKIADVPAQKGKADWFSLYLHPFEDQYLYSEFSNGLPSGGRIDTVVLFALIGALTLLIACFNFVNLATARAAKRSPAIGMRKIIGAGRASLVFQFLVESLLLIIFSLAAAVLLTQVSLPYFNELTGKAIAIDYFDGPFFQLILLVCLATLLFSGVYPAYFLSSFRAANVVKGWTGKKAGSSISHVFLRRVLVVLQFSIAIALVAGTSAVLLQMEFVRNKNLGLDKENVLYIPLDFKTGPNYEAIKNKLTKHVSIQAVSASSTDFMNGLGMSSDPVWRKKSKVPDHTKTFAIVNTRVGLLEMLNIELAEGRYFSSELKSDTSNFIINERAAEAMGFDDPVGEDLELWGVKGKIIGVVRDFNYTSLHSDIQPAIVRIDAYSQLLFAKTTAGKTLEAIEHIEDVLSSFTSLPISFHFLDKTLESGYRREITIQKLAGWFSGFAIVISCLGILGLATYTAERRAREIAIRRVLGARVDHILGLLYREYVVLIILGIIFGAPVAYFWIENWLNNFAYRIQITWWLFVLPAVLVFLTALITISRLSVKTASSNPVKYLRNE